MRFAHITDLHARYALPNSSRFPARRSRCIRSLFSRALDFLKKEWRVDLLLITGDLVDVPFYAIERKDPEILSLAREDYLWIYRCLEDIGIPYLVFWGNHDDKDTFQHVFPLPPLDCALRASTSGTMDLVIPPASCGDRGTRSFPSTTDTLQFQTFPFDEEQPDHLPYRDLSRYPEPTPPQGPAIHVQHYVVAPKLNDFYPHTYLNDAEIQLWNRAHRVTLSLSGHYHPGYPPLQIEGTWYATGAAFCEYPYPVYLYEYPAQSSQCPFRVITLQMADLVSLPPVTTITFPKPPSGEPFSAAAIEDPFGEFCAPTGATVGFILPPWVSEEECDRLWVEWNRLGKEKGYTVEGVYAQ